MFKNILKIGIRNLWKHKGFSALNIVGLAIGITASFLILTYVAFELSYDNFHSKSDRIFRLVSDVKTPTGTLTPPVTSWAVPPHLQEQMAEVESTVRILGFPLLVRYGESKFQENKVILADPDFFKVFDFNLIRGDAKTVLKAPFSVLLSQSAAKRYFGNEDPIGKSIKVMDEGYDAQVTGLMADIPENSTIQADIVLSLTTLTERLQPDLNNQWGNYQPTTYVLLKPNTSSEKVSSKLPDFLERNIGEEMRKDEMFVTLILEPLRDVYLHSDRGGDISGNIFNLYIFSLIALIILIIVSINFINLTTARSVERSKEVGVRKVLGAYRRNLKLQFISETILISLFAYIVAVIISILAMPLFNQLAGKTINQSVFADPKLLFILLGVTLLTGLLAGIYPATVISSFEPGQILKGNFKTSGKGILLRRGLVVLQFAISIVMIIFTLVIYEQLHYMQDQNLGFNKDQIVAIPLNSAGKQTAFLETLKTLSNITAVSTSSAVPGDGNFMAYTLLEDVSGNMQVANLNLYSIDYDFIPEYGLKMIAGRAFSRKFPTDSVQALVINKKASDFLGYTDPKEAIGANFDQWGRKGQVIGVVQNFHFQSLKQDIVPLSLRVEPNDFSKVSIKISGNIPATMDAIKDKWETFFPDRPFEYTFLDALFDRQYQNEQRFGSLFLSFALLAIFLSCMGLLGLAAYSTLQRRKEIGIRKVLGASIGTILSLISKDFLRLVGIGFLFAVPIAWVFADRWLANFAYRIDVHWWIFIIAGLSVASIALLSVGFMSVKSAMMNPVKSLRTE